MKIQVAFRYLYILAILLYDIGDLLKLPGNIPFGILRAFFLLTKVSEITLR